jgi:hypothetical protein
VPHVPSAAVAPCLQVVSNDLRRPVRGDDHVQVIRSAVDLEQSPAANPTCLRDLLLYHLALLVVQKSGGLGHSRLCFKLARRLGELSTLPVFNPAAFIARQPRSVGGPCQKIRQWLRHWRPVLSCAPHEVRPPALADY